MSYSFVCIARRSKVDLKKTNCDCITLAYTWSLFGLDYYFLFLLLLWYIILLYTIFTSVYLVYLGNVKCLLIIDYVISRHLKF